LDIHNGQVLWTVDQPVSPRLKPITQNEKILLFSAAPNSAQVSLHSPRLTVTTMPPGDHHEKK